MKLSIPSANEALAACTQSTQRPFSHLVGPETCSDSLTGVGMEDREDIPNDATAIGRREPQGGRMDRPRENPG